MLSGFFQRPLGALLLTAAAAAALLFAGWWLGSRSGQGQMAEGLRQAAAEASRANLLASEMASLEERLKTAQQRLELCQSRRAAGPTARPTLLKQDEASLFLGDKVVITLEKSYPDPPRALLRVRVLGQAESRANLRVGDVYSFRQGGRLYNLLLRQAGPGQALVSLLQ